MASLRGEKEILTGDGIRPLMPQGDRRYAVDRNPIVTPDHTSVLEPREKRSVTLVPRY